MSTCGTHLSAETRKILDRYILFNLNTFSDFEQAGYTPGYEISYVDFLNNGEKDPGARVREVPNKTSQLQKFLVGVANYFKTQISLPGLISECNTFITAINEMGSHYNVELMPEDLTNPNTILITSSGLNIDNFNKAISGGLNFTDEEIFKMLETLKIFFETQEEEYKDERKMFGKLLVMDKTIGNELIHYISDFILTKNFTSNTYVAYLVASKQGQQRMDKFFGKNIKEFLSGYVDQLNKKILQDTSILLQDEEFLKEYIDVATYINEVEKYTCNSLLFCNFMFLSLPNGNNLTYKTVHINNWYDIIRQYGDIFITSRDEFFNKICNRELFQEELLLFVGLNKFKPLNNEEKDILKKALKFIPVIHYEIAELLKNIVDVPEDKIYYANSTIFDLRNKYGNYNLDFIDLMRCYWVIICMPENIKKYFLEKKNTTMLNAKKLIDMDNVVVESVYNSMNHIK